MISFLLRLMGQCLWKAGVIMQFLWPMGLLTLGAILSGGNNQAGPGVLAATVVRGVCTAQILPLGHV